MRWLPVAFLTNGVFVTHGGFELTPLCYESACFTTATSESLVLVAACKQLYHIVALYLPGDVPF